VNALAGGNTIVPRGDGKYNAFQILGSTLENSLTLPVLPHDFVYYVHSATIHVRGASSPVLTLPTGSIFKMWYSRFAIGDGDPGGLVAEDVLFTSVRDDTGGDTNGASASPSSSQWQRVSFMDEALDGESSLVGCEFRYGGSGNAGSLRVRNSTPELKDCLVTLGHGPAVYVHGAAANPRLWFTTMSDSDVGLKTADFANVHLVRCCFEGNDDYGFEVVPGSGSGTQQTQLAENCWWGVADGPSGMGPGTGDAVTDLVAFDPWALVPACQDLPTAVGETIVTRLTVGSPYPNPFNPSTTIDFELPRSASVEIDIIALDGRRVIRLVDATLAAGPHSTTWRGRDETGRSVAAGLYLYRVRANGEAVRGKLLLMK